MAKSKKTKPLSASEMTAENLRELDQDTLVGLVIRVVQQNQQLSELLQAMVRDKHGSKNEKFENPGQLNLFNDEAPVASSSSVQSTSAPSMSDSKLKKKTGHFRNPMPSNLEHVKISGKSLSDEQCVSCTKTYVKVREIIRSSRYEYKPAKVFVQDFVATIFECCGCGETCTVEPEVSQTIDNGLAGPGLQAEIITAKFEDHLPLHRQEQRFERLGVSIPRSTMVGWVTAAASLLEPIYTALHQTLLQSRIIETDDTPTKVQDKSKKKNIKIGHIWTYRGDKNHPVTLFDYTEGRGRAGPLKFLRGYTGYLQGDCFSGNLAVCAGTGATFVACGVHARRYFVKAQPNNKARCDEALQMWSDLFEVERSARELKLSAEQTSKMRQEESVPILTKMKTWLDDQRLSTLPQSSFGKAVQYSLNNWTELTNYLLDGDLRLDNNLAEQEMKRIAIGRKNWYFFGSDDGGRRAAILLSLISTCKRHGINATEYLKDVLQTLADEPTTDVEKLLPYNWQKKYDFAEMEPCQTAPKFATV